MRIAVHIQTCHNDVAFPRMLFEVVHSTLQFIDPLIMSSLVVAVQTYGFGR